MLRIGQSAVVAMLLLAWTAGAWAQGPSNQQLQQTIEALQTRLAAQEQRIAEMEGRTERDPANLSPQDIAAIMAELQAEDAATDPWAVNTTWRNGLRFSTADGTVQAAMGGRAFVDFGCATSDFDGTDPVFHGARIRAARLNFSADMNKALRFNIEYDFAPATVSPKNIFLQFTRLPLVDSLTIGHFKEPFSIEQLTSGRFTTFMERSLVNTLVPGRALGAAVAGAVFEQRGTYSAGVFRENTATEGIAVGHSGWAFTGRATALPWYEDKGRRLLHVGASYSYRNPDGDVRFRARPEARLMETRFTDTGAFAADDMHLFGAEAALVYGPFSLQGEYVGAAVDAAGNGTACLHGASVQASYFLTGEHRNYSRGSGAFNRITPLRPFGVDGGKGAWEVAARYSYLDLDDAAVPGAGLGANEIQNVTLGLNWYLNPNVRLMWNYIYSDVDAPLADSSAHIAMMRVQFDW